MKSVVVTGSSTGIGWGIAKVLISKGFRVFGSVRKAADGERLKAEFGANFVPVIFDVTDEGAVATPIWDKADSVDPAIYANTPYMASLTKVKEFMLALGRKGLKPEVLGESVWIALTTAKPKVRYTVTPDPFQNFLVNTLPKRMVDYIVAGRLGLKRIQN